MKINILCREINQNITGGNIYDTYLFQRIALNKEFELNYITDKQLGCSNLLFYSWHCWKNRKRIVDCEKIIINSSRFSKVLPFVWYLKYKFPQKQVITIHHHFGFRQLNGIKRYLYRWMELSFLKMCDIIITPNPYVREELLQLYRDSKIRFLELSFDKCTQTHIIDKHIEGRLLYVGTIEKRKGLIYLIDAIGQMSQCYKERISLLIVGKIVEEDYYKRLKQRIEYWEIGNIVKFAGRLSADDLSQAYQDAYCFVFPSLHEGYGMVIIEAMSYGLPVISFDNSAMPYTIKHGYNGLLVPTKSINGFMKELEHILSNKDLHKQLSVGALKTFQQVRSWEDLNRDIDSFANSLIKNLELSNYIIN